MLTEANLFLADMNELTAVEMAVDRGHATQVPSALLELFSAMMAGLT